VHRFHEFSAILGISKVHVCEKLRNCRYFQSYIGNKNVQF